MDPRAKALIEKIALSPETVGSALGQRLRRSAVLDTPFDREAYARNLSRRPIGELFRAGKAGIAGARKPVPSGEVLTHLWDKNDPRQETLTVPEAQPVLNGMATGRTALFGDVGQRGYSDLTPLHMLRPPTGDKLSMETKATELIRKMAFEKKAVSAETAGKAWGMRFTRAQKAPSGSPDANKYEANKGMHAKKQMGYRFGSKEHDAYGKGTQSGIGLEHERRYEREDNMPAYKKASSDMKSIISDIIKGAQDNSFKRPVTIQNDTEWTHLDTAKVAGTLQALAEREYSVKEAAEYLGLTEAQVQSILETVR